MTIKRTSSAYAIVAVTMLVTFAGLEMTTQVLTNTFNCFLDHMQEIHPEATNAMAPTSTDESTPLLKTRHNSTAPVVLPSEQKELNILRENGMTQRLGHLRLEKLTYQQLSLIIHSYLDNANTICARKLRMGNIGDGGWEICDDPDVRPLPPCIIYSFGIGKDFSFDDEASKWYKCHVYSFDPSISLQTYNRSERVHFYNLGIAGTSYTNGKGWRYSKLSEIRAMLGHSGYHIGVIKMDIEGAEWDSIKEMVMSHQMYNVDQFLVEYHIHSLTRSSLLHYLRTLQALELAGFRIFYTHKNEGCGYHVVDFPPIISQCFEVHYRRIKQKKAKNI